MKNDLFLNFHLFDGEGGGEGATASTAESTQEQQPRIEYGKSRGEGSAPSQVGSDNSAQAEDLSAEWKALTGKGGKFHDLYGQGVSQAVQDRFKNQQELQGQVDRIADDLSPLFMNYGLSAGDFEGLAEAVAKDDAFYQAGAERLGLDVEQYKERLKLQADAERGRQITEAYERQQRQNEVYAEWEADASELQKAFPMFDLGMEIRTNERFAQLIDNGVSVQDAFYTTHMGDILGGANVEANKIATQNVVNTIQQRAARPPEAAMGHSPAIERRSDPSQLTADDLDEINRRVEMGETFAF